MTVLEGPDVAGDAKTLLDLKAEDDPRTIPQMKADDDTWTEGPVIAVTLYEDGTHWSVEWTEVASGQGEPFGSAVGIGVPKIEGKPEPKIGDTIRTYGRFGGPVHGIDLNGVEVYWDTPWERFSKRIKMLAGFDRERREEFVEQVAELDAKYEALPAPLKARIDRFRAEREDFRIDGEAYEMAAVADAPKIARAIAEENGWMLDDDVRVVPLDDESEEARKDREAVIAAGVEKFRDLSYEEQKRLVPDLDPGHSGNTFGGAVRLAYGLLVGEKL